MSSQWQEVPFEAIVRARGSGPLSLPKSQWEGEGRFPVIGQGAAEIEGWTDRSDLVIDCTRPLVLFGGHTRRAKIVDRPFVPGPNVRILEPHEGLDARFLFYFLSCLELDDKGYADHFPLVRKCSVPLPPLDKQKRIVALLDQAFAALDRARANAESNLGNASQLRVAAMEQLFPNDDKIAAGNSLDELCEAIVDCEHKTAPTQDRGIPSIRTPNVGKGVLLLNGVNRVSEETYREWTRRAEPRAGDLILAREAPAGNVAVIPEGMRVCLGQRTVLLRPKRGLFIPAYLAHLLLRPSSQERLLAHSRGATVQHINVKDIRSFWVSSLPPLGEQRAVVRGIEGLMADEQSLLDAYTRKLADIAALRQSLLQAAFSGQLT